MTPHYRKGPPPDDDAPPQPLGVYYAVTISCRDWLRPLRLRLPGVLASLLVRIGNLQALQRGETLDQPYCSEGDPIAESCDRMRPSYTEACLVAALGLVRRCLFRGSDEVMIVTCHEAEALREQRRRNGTGPVSDLQREGFGGGPPDARQLRLGAELQAAIDPDWRPISERALTGDP